MSRPQRWPHSVVPTVDTWGRPSYLVVHAETRIPVHVLGIYTAHLSVTSSPNHVRNQLRNLLPLLQWALAYGLDLPAQLLSGGPFALHLIRSYRKFLGDIQKRNGGPLSPLYIDLLLGSACDLSQYWQDRTTEAEPQKREWRLRQKREELAAWRLVRAKPAQHAQDRSLTPEQLAIIDRYLDPAKAAASGRHIAYRNYLAFMYVSHFGLRVGELLCLRTCDVNLKFGGDLGIRVIQDPKQLDPRSYPPQLKTGPRELLALSRTNLVFELTELYLNSYRRQDEGTDFFFTSAYGRPLSVSSLEKLGARITRDCDFAFWWHRLRHTFAAWLYREAAVQGYDKKNVKDGVDAYMGWHHPGSDQPYLAAARHDESVRFLRDMLRRG